MKKKIFLVSTLLVVAMSAMFVSCKKDEPSNGCWCNITYYGEGYRDFYPLDYLSDYGVKTCSALEKFLEIEFVEAASCSAE